MAAISRFPEEYSAFSGVAAATVADPLLPWLWKVKNVLDGDLTADEESLAEILFNCISTFKSDVRYQNDVRFLKIWFFYMDCSSDFENVLVEMEQNRICMYNSIRYECCALFLEAKGRLIDANSVYQLGISRIAEPIGRLKKAHTLFLARMSEIVNGRSVQKNNAGDHLENSESCINPWLNSTINDLLKKMNPQLLKYEGYHSSNKLYSGKVALSSLQKSARNKVIEIGGKKYQIKGQAGQGAFAQVFKANANSNPDEVVALKIQKPAFPWEFYMYRQLDERISDRERLYFGFAHRLHLYSDYSILVSDYLPNGTLQDAINSYAVVGGFMEEVLCIYYTIEMLLMLETLHGTGIIHGDFKPDNLLIRYARDDLTEDGFRDHTGPWRDQGLCLVDWGRGIDLSLFRKEIEFMGDSRTSGFRCVEMQEKKPWKFQVDTYGLCVTVHLMLHNQYMEVERKASSDGSYVYKPKLSFRRYWQVELWKNLFTKLLNFNANEDHKKLLQDLRVSFQDYMCSNSQLIKKLKQVLVKQRTSLCSA